MSKFTTRAYKILQNQAPWTSHQILLSPLPISKPNLPATQNNDPSFPKVISSITYGRSLFFPLPCFLPNKLHLQILLECHLLCKIFPKHINFLPSLLFFFIEPCTSGVLINDPLEFYFFHWTMEYPLPKVNAKTQHLAFSIVPGKNRYSTGVCWNNWINRSSMFNHVRDLRKSWVHPFSSILLEVGLHGAVDGPKVKDDFWISFLTLDFRWVT